MATTKKSEATPSSADALEAILNKLGAMDERITNMEKRSSEPPKLKVVPQETADPYTEKPSSLVYSDASSILNEGDVIRLKPDSEKAQAIMSDMTRLRPDVQEKIKEKGILGIVKEHKMTSSSGDPKFRVNLPGIGIDGVYLSELDVVERV
jgi:hypothetical protein